jgi:HlyD family secretion protein
MKRYLKISALIAIVAGLVMVGLASFRRANKASADTYRLSTLRKGDLTVTINATGTVEPEEVIDVGAQVAGRIRSFGKDRNGKPVDYGSAVQQGTVLARIDDSLYLSDVAQASAASEQAKANLARAEADLGQLQAKLQQAQNDWNRAQQLGPSDALSHSSYDAYKAAFETAKANLAVGQATIAQNRGAVLQAEAALARAKENLGYTTIVSPVNGVIIDRRVNIGQTVVASLNAPSLFLIAKDLSRMQIWVSVNEADIASIHPGQPVTFTVDAHPGQTFRGKVGKVRLNAAMTQNVVTYTVEVVTDNSKRMLLPYLTANVKFEVARRPDVLMVPNAALKWIPKPEQIAPEFSKVPESQQALARTDVPERHGGKGNRFQQESRTATLWVLAENGVRPIPVQLGLSDGVRTEVQGDELQEGVQVVVGDGGPGPGASQVQGQSPSNPFAPQFRGRQGGGRSSH